MLPLKVLGDRVLVKPDVNANAPEQLESGVILAATMAAAVTGEDATTSVCRGTVIAVGNPKHPLTDDASELADWLVSELQSYSDRVNEAAVLLRDLVRREPCCKAGDDVLFSHDAGQQITLESEIYILLKEDELLAIVEPEEELTHG